MSLADIKQRVARQDDEFSVTQAKIDIARLLLVVEAAQIYITKMKERKELFNHTPDPFTFTFYEVQKALEDL